eukprot:12615824-Alexandrium_andersonii.AAC.1
MPTRWTSPSASPRSPSGGRQCSHHASPACWSEGVRKTAATSSVPHVAHWCGRWWRCSRVRRRAGGRRPFARSRNTWNAC